MRRLLPDIAIITGLLILAILFFAPATIGGRTIIPADNLYQDEPYASVREAVGVPEIPHNGLLSDLILQNYQWKSFIRENISDREFPLWQPNMLAGSPFMANGQHSMLYPFSILYYILPLSEAFGWFTVSQLWLAGLFMYLYLRGIGRSRMAGLIGALTVEFSSFFIVSTVHPMIQAGAAWLPFLLLMIEWTLQARPFIGTQARPTRLPWVLLGGVALGMVHLAGHIEITYYTLLVMAIYAALRLLVMWRKEGHTLTAMLRPALLLVLMVVLGFGVGAVQFIPNLEAANNSFRTDREGDSLATVRSYALPKRHIAKFIMPNVYGNPAHHEYVDVFEGEVVTQDWLLPNPDKPDEPTRITNTDFGIKNYVEGGAYMGILPLVLALIAVIVGIASWRRDQFPTHTLIFVVLILIALSFAFGTPTYALLYYGLPGIDQLHTPFRWLWIITVSVGVLAGFGVDALRERPQLARRVGTTTITTGLAVLGGLAISYLAFDQIRPLVERIYDGLAKANTTFATVEAFYSYQFRNVLLLGVFTLLAGVVIRLHNRDWHWRGLPLWGALAVAVLVLDLGAATYDFNTYARTEWLDYKPSSVQWLQDRMAESDQPFRIYAYQWKKRVLHANAGWGYGLHDLRGYDSLFSKDYADLMARITPQDGLDSNRIVPIIAWQHPDHITNPLLDYLNVRYVITDWLIEDAEAWGFNEVYVDGGVRIYENLEVLPRAYTFPTAAIEGCDPILPDLALIPPEPTSCGDVTPAIIQDYRDTEVRVEVNVDEPVWLVLADNMAPGWRAFVRPIDGTQDDEQKLDIATVNGTLRGVPLEPGQWLVRFDYSPASFQLGAFASFVTGMLIIFMALIWLWQTFISQTADQDTGRRLVKNSLAPIFLNLFNRGIDFAFAFIMLRILGPSDAGIYYYAIVIFGWFDIFTNFGLNTLLTREVSRRPESAGRYLFNTSVIRIGLALLGIPALGAVLLIRNATVTPELDATAITAIILLYLGLIPNSITTGLSALFYAFEKAEFPAAIATVTTLVKVTLGLGALLLGWGVVGLAGASILTNLVTFAIMARLAFPLIKANWEPTVDASLQRHMMRESWPLMINHLLATVFFKSDVILMEAINGVKIVGIYSTSYKWLDAINIIPAFFTMALLPVMSRQAHEDAAGLRRNYVMGIKLLVMTALPVAVVTTYLARYLIGFLGGPEFLPDGAIALQIMIWSIPLGWMNSLTQYVLIALDRQRQITGAFIAAVSFNVITNLIFLPAYSYRAAAITTIFSELVLLVGFYYLLRGPLGHINWAGALWKPWLATALMFGVFVVLWQVNGLLALLIATTVYVGTLLALNPFDSEEMARLGPLLPRPVRRLMWREAR